MYVLYTVLDAALYQPELASGDDVVITPATLREMNRNGCNCITCECWHLQYGFGSSEPPRHPLISSPQLETTNLHSPDLNDRAPIR